MSPPITANRSMTIRFLDHSPPFGRVQLSRWRTKADGKTSRVPWIWCWALIAASPPRPYGSSPAIWPACCRIDRSPVSWGASPARSTTIATPGAPYRTRVDACATRRTGRWRRSSPTGARRLRPSLLPSWCWWRPTALTCGAQHESSPKNEVRTGVFYSGKQRAGGRKHRRWRLVNKGVYAACLDPEAAPFGMGLALAGFVAVGLDRAANVLCVHDGIDEYGATFRDWFPPTRCTRPTTTTWPGTCGPE